MTNFHCALFVTFTVGLLVLSVLEVATMPHDFGAITEASEGTSN